MANVTSQSGDVLSGIVGLFLLFGIGSCVFGGSDESKATSETPKMVAAASSQPAGFGANILEQAIFDAFPVTPPKTQSARHKASNAADYVGQAINAAGHLCNKVVEAQRVAAGQYGVGCRKRRDGGSANFIIDVRTGSVSVI